MTNCGDFQLRLAAYHFHHASLFVALFQQQLVPAQRSVPCRHPHHAPPGPQTERGGRIFCALHTYGRQLNQHLHIYLSVTHSRLDIKYGIWRDLLFKKHAVEEI